MHIKNILFLLLFGFIVFSLNSVGQDVNYEADRSKNKVIINGKKYYIHIVKKNETIYSLCRIYNVSQKVLEENNPEIKRGLKVNSSLKIPMMDQLKDQTLQAIIHIVESGETVYSIATKYNLNVEAIYMANPEARVSIHPGQELQIVMNIIEVYEKAEEDDRYIYHKVEIGETAYSIARRYGLKVKQLNQDNKKIDLQNLQVGQIISIPKKKIDLILNEPGTYDDHFYYLKIERKQTLYSISKRFKIDIKDIKKANPELKKRELIAGETIRIPILNEFIFAKINKQKDSDFNDDNDDDDDDDEYIDSVKEYVVFDSASYPCRDYNYKEDSNVFEVGLFLPIYGIINDSLDKNIEEKNRNLIIYNRSKIFIEFYQGALIALFDLQKENMKLNLHLFDTNNDTIITRQHVESEKFKDLDLIIGPVYANNLDIVAKKAKENKISLVSPLLKHDEIIENNLYAFQANPSSEIKINYWLNTIMEHQLENIIIIHDGNNFERDFSQKFKERYFKTFASKIDSQNIFFKEHLYFNSNDTVIGESMIKDLKNIVIIPSANQAYVTDIMAKLNTLALKFDITVFGMDIWVTYSNIELECFHNLNTHVFANSFIDYNDYAVNEFIKKYRSYYYAEPGKFSFQGYDITYYFVKALQIFGNEFRFCLNDFNPQLLQTNFNFKRYVNADGFFNNSLFTIVYERDFTRQIHHHSSTN